MTHTVPKMPEWFRLMISDALTDYDSQVSFSESVEKAWRRTCRGRTHQTVGAMDMDTGRVVYFRDHVTIVCPYRPENQAS